MGRTPKGAYSTRGRSRHLLETAFSEPLLRTLLRTLFYCKTHSRPPSQNPSENPSPEPCPAQRLTFWVRRPPGGVGVFHEKGWWSKTSCSPSKLRLPWVSKRGIWDVPEILPGCPGKIGGVQKVCAKKVRAHFSFPIWGAAALPKGAGFANSRCSLENASARLARLERSTHMLRPRRPGTEKDSLKTPNEP